MMPYPEFEAVVLSRLRANNYRCCYCRQPLELYPLSPVSFSRVISIDHRDPLSRDGKTDPENIDVSCARCNLVKGTITGSTFDRALGVLRREDPALLDSFLDEAMQGALARKMNRLTHERADGVPR